MPTASNQGVSLHYDVDGDGESVAFVGTVGYGAWIWSTLHPEVAGPRRAVVWDLRGTGESDAPPGPYDVDQLAADLEAVLADAGVESAHVVGAGLGGMVALRYAREYGRARSLALFSTAAAGEDVDEAALRTLHPNERKRGAVRASLDGAFSEKFRAENPDVVAQVVDWRLDEDAGPEAIEAQVAAALEFESGPLYEVTIPALVCTGVDDPVMPEAAGEELAEELPRGEFEPVVGRHLAFFEAGSAVADRLVAFFDEVGAED